MNNIKDLFNERDMIIESMGYFNPLILEEHDVILTEGIVGGLVEKIQALWKMIKGWITKLIDFVASKFKRNKPVNNKDKNTDDNANNVIANLDNTINYYQKQKENLDNANKEFEKIIDKLERDISKITEDDTEQRKKIQEEINQQKATISKMRERMKTLPQRIEKQQENIKELMNKKASINNAEIKLPELEFAKKAVNNIINDCKKALTKSNPYENFGGKNLKSYFEKSGEKSIKVQSFLQDAAYKSYSYKAGEECVDQLRGYQKALEATYKQLESMAEHVNDSARSNEIMNRAKGVNKLTQNVLKGTVSILSHYVSKITSLRSKCSVDVKNNDSALKSAQNKLEELRTDMLNQYNETISDASKKIIELENKLK